MAVALSEELLRMAEQVCRAAREQGRTVFTVYHGESDRVAESELRGTVKEKQIWQT
jgi:hypothetical protein